MPTRILIADDHEIVRQGIRTIFQARPEWSVCGEAVNGQEAVRLARELKPDLIVMDITMPVMSGLEATREISQLRVNTKMLIFTMHDASNLYDAARKAGASGCVLKSRAAQDLVSAVERLIGGGTFFESTP